MFRLSVAALVVSTCAVAAAQGSPTIPSWIHPGLTVIYDGESASRNGAGFAQPVRVAVVTRVRVVNSRGVAAASLIQSVGAPVQNTIIWSCNAAGTCHGSRPGFNGKFWVDPADPAGSAAGPNGETYRVVGTGPYKVAGKTWRATTMSYRNAATGVKLSVVFETATGLVLSYAESEPSEETHLSFSSMR